VKTFSPARPRVAPRPDVAAFEQLARALVGITLKSLSALDGAVSVPQFRLLLTLDGLGRVPSSALAEALGMSASSVTRLVDRLQAAGLVERGSVEHSRSIVTVEVTARGCALVTAVLDRRHALLEDALDRMEPQERERAGHLAASFVDLAGDALALGVNGPVPL
jgi:DNA-binding MarR family transcriptional regulator